ncbi:HsdR family type I site-specific deoxyribonuclease [Vibrio furnissii]|uniref:type I restriction endonuclease subunit R n=1 Tax=Vibrio furnissii TaxID=29494 RepID=UPI0024BA53E7|nr:HsdR family type I site-specific deoxyribonuclease [Vibrio furnissii]WHR51252.1 HsdR family type I site-specific deoxyribonuclease [Vibrio furnissii]
MRDSDVGQRENETQKRVIKLFQQQLGYDYFGDWKRRSNNRNIEESILIPWLRDQGVSDVLINRVLHKLSKASAMGEGKHLYEANKDVYRLLRYGVKEKEGAGEQNKTTWLIDWESPENNRFGIAEEVTVKGENDKRPDLVLYVNGIALGVIELKRSKVSVGEGIRQNLDNQKKDFIRSFFTTVQLVMAGNDTEGLRYGTIETPEKYYLEWKELKDNPLPFKLDEHLSCICSKPRLLQIIHDFIVFDAGIKKTCRHNQFFGIEAAKPFIQERRNGIIWHTQGSGKSLTMVWLAKWIREHVEDARVLVVTDRTELDDQIEQVFGGVDEEIHRTKSGADLVATLNNTNPWLICSIVHKFGRQGERKDDDEATDEYIRELKASLPSDFCAKGNITVFVDECHRTQSGKLHKAMNAILPDANFIGFTGTPLLKKDKKTSAEVFGPYIHTYKFKEAVDDGVVLDLRYEARDIDQHITSEKAVDVWFEAKTKGLSSLAKTELKRKWGTMQKVLSSKPRLEMIVNDILLDMDTKPRLMDHHGNAMLVCASVHQACTIYDLFSQTELKGKCAIITSYKPSSADIKGEETGEGLTEKLFKYDVYRKMLADYFEIPVEQANGKVEEFEAKVKEKFKKEPGQMRLLIVVDKLLTGFDAPSATYLYIDKKMTDHTLFQAICRVNRLDGDEKDYGFIVDYKDLFKSLEKSMKDYNGEGLGGYDKEDINGLLTDRLERGKTDLDNALDMVKGICEEVKQPRNTIDYLHYFCGQSGDNDEVLSDKEALRLMLYKAVAKLMRAYTTIANEMEEAGYTLAEAAQIKADVTHYSAVREEVKLASNDHLDMKRLEPAMRRLMDTYIRADNAESLMDFEELSLLDLFIDRGADCIKDMPEGFRKDESAMAEAIENNVRSIISDENIVNPKYYEAMSTLLHDLIEQRRRGSLDYQKYLEEMRELARKVKHPESNTQVQYPESMDTNGKRSLYDNLGEDAVLVTKIDTAIRYTKRADWIGDRFKEKAVANAVRQEIEGTSLDILDVMELIKAQVEYH